MVADTDFDIALEPALSEIQTSGDQFNNTFFIEHLSYPTMHTRSKVNLTSLLRHLEAMINESGVCQGGYAGPSLFGILLDDTFNMLL